MVELMLALVIIAIFMTAIALALGTAVKSSRSDSNRMVTSNLAATLMDQVRATDFDTLRSQLGTTVVDPTTTKVNGVQYTARQTIKWVPGNGTLVNCGSGSDAANVAYLRVDIAVTWPNMAGVQPVTNSTVISPPVGQYNTATGAVATQVTDIDGTPQSGITATLNGPGGPQTQLTTDQGCAFFPFLANGTYTLTINKSGYVDTKGVASPQGTAIVTPGPVISVPTFTYDQATTINATLAPGTDVSGTAGAMPTSPVLLPLTLANSHLQPTGWQQITGTGTSVSRTIANAFPFRDGYSIWPGTCPSDSDPDMYRVQPTDPSLREPAIDSPPGGTASTTLPLPALAVTVRKASMLGLPQANKSVTLVYAGTDTSCAGTLSYGVTTGTSGASAGRVVLAAPYGTWQVRVAGMSPIGGSWPTIQLTPSNSTLAQELTVMVV